MTYSGLDELVNRAGNALARSASPANSESCCSCTTARRSTRRSSARSGLARSRFPMNTLLRQGDYQFVLNDSRRRRGHRQRAADQRDAADRASAAVR